MEAIEQKPKRKRSNSKFIVLKNTSEDGLEGVYEIVGESSTRKSAIKLLTEKHDEGKYIIACVHGSVEVKTETVKKVVNIK